MNKIKYVFVILLNDNLTCFGPFLKLEPFDEKKCKNYIFVIFFGNNTSNL